MEPRSELQARRDALEGELLALQPNVPGDGPHGSLASVEQLQRVDRLLAQLGVVNQALSEPGSTPLA